MDLVIRVFLWFLLFTASSRAQDAWLPALLPSDARIIGTAPVHSRLLVLWMQHPQRVIRNAEGGCEAALYGDHWLGPARLSLVNPTTKRVINTVVVRDASEPREDAVHVSIEPFKLRDITGEGVAGQFELFHYVTCGNSATTVLGYSPRLDKAIQYDIGPRKWHDHPLGEAPVSPGRYILDWDPGHGCFCAVHDEIAFDRTRQIFTLKRRSATSPAAGTPASSR